MFKILKLLIVLLHLKFIESQVREVKLNNAECGNQNGWFLTKVYYKKADKQDYENNRCLANIINDDWLITAASCVWDYKNPESYEIHFVPTIKELSKKVGKIVRSPKYNPTLGAGYDIALIKLKNGLIKYNYTICLPDFPSKSSFTTSDGVCQLKRYEEGAIGVSNGIPINIVDFKTCAGTYVDLINESHMVCVESKTKVEGFCIKEGDTGAPLMCLDNNRGDKKYYLTGIASWGQRVCGQNYDVFTKLYDNEYLKWINETIHLN